MRFRHIIFFFIFVILRDLPAQTAQHVEAGRVIVQLSSDAVHHFETRLRTLNRTASDSSEFRTGIRSIDDINRRYKATNMERVFPHGGKYEAKQRKYGLHLWYKVLICEDEDPEAVAAAYAMDDNVLIAEPRYKIRRAGMLDASNDPEFGNQWNFNNTGQSGGVAGADIRLVEAWEKAKTLGIKNNNVIVAVVDGGIYHTHEDLRANIWVNEAEYNGTYGIDDDDNGYVDDVYGYNFVKNTGNINPEAHATHVAGVIAAVTGNGVGVSGIAGSADDGYNIKLMNVQIFDGNNYVDNIGAAFVYAANNGAVISQNSWGYERADEYQNSDIAAINYFINEAGKDEYGNPRPGTPMSGGIVIFAASNDGRDGKWYPAYFDNVLAVAATNHQGRLAHYSNFGSWIDISAPGGDTRGTNRRGGVFSTSYRANNNNFYEYMQGTSMACPHVSGVAALILSVYGSECFTPDMLRARLLSSATPLTTFDPVNASVMGAGLVNAAAALTPFSAPHAINDLTAQGLNAVSCQLNWTTPETSDKLGYYIIACATENITEENFDEYIYEHIIMAQETETNMQVVIAGLNPNTKYYIALRSTDFECQTSIISNVATVTTRDNSPPVLSEPLPEPFPNINLRDIAGETEFYIGDVFTDADGDEMTYTISYNSILVSSASIAGDLLYIRPRPGIEGSTTLTLTANDGNTGTADLNISLTVARNKSPVFTGLISDTTLIPYSEPLVIDLSKYAADPENDIITFSVLTNNEDILTARIPSGSSILTINPQRHGNALIRITATDQYSASTIVYIRITVEQKYSPETHNQLLVYPNPTTDIFRYSFIIYENSALVIFRIVDSSGRSMFQTPAENLAEGIHYKSINLQGWGAGLYYIQYLKNGKIIDVKGFVKQGN